MSIANVVLDQLSAVLGVQIIAQDVYVLAAMLIIIVLTSRILVNTLNVLEEVLEYASSSNIFRLPKSKNKKNLEAFMAYEFEKELKMRQDM